MASSQIAAAKRPMIAVTGPDRLLKFGWWATRFQLRRVGLRGVYVSRQCEELLPDIDGVIIGGGDDINPIHYGATGAAGAIYDAKRDELELQVIDMALQNDIPMLGICRGAQLINVACGGNLIEDLRPLREKTPNRNSVRPIKNAIIEPHSKLYSILGKECVRVNSLHHQAVKEVGDGLTAVAKDEDGFIQAIESSGEQFIVGVQWHPEYMPQRKTQTRIFRALADAVVQRRDRKRL
ncbi:MAG: gamma-glutamyl-gamma-aminobutyrate hydrolase family protein [Gammaproteobacteria bacterium]|nr:gamma-glutamyl-gamma-aminobutyrate hydrolase family protein [Gammaproteobacteria bacterium]